MAPLKIGVLIGSICPGGPTKIAINEVHNLRNMGFDAHLVVLNKPKSKSYLYDDIINSVPIIDLSKRLLPIFRFNHKLPFFSFFSFFHIISALLVPLLIRKHEFEIILVHETYTCFTAYSIMKLRGIPYIAYIHDPMWYILSNAYSKTLMSYFSSFLVKLAKIIDLILINGSVFTVTNSYSTLLRCKTLNPQTHLQVLYPGCTPLKELPHTRKSFILAFTKWDFTKKPQFILDIASQLSIPAKFRIAGFWYPENLRKQFVYKIEQSKLKNEFELSGPISEKDVRVLYQSARCLIHPIVEGFGMTALEALSCGCPVIFPEGSGVSELFGDGEGGFFPKAGDTSTYVYYIDKFITNEKFAIEIGSIGWKTSILYNWVEHTQKIIKIISDLSKVKK